MNLAFEIAKKGLQNSQVSLNVATNNMVNAENENYTRQVANVKSSLYLTKGNYTLGTGATITSVDRVRLGFYDRQYRDNIGVYSGSATKTEALIRIETYLGSLDGSTGLKITLNSFFDSLEELSKNPESTGIKSTVKDAAISLTTSFNQISTSLLTMKEQYSSYTEEKVAETNKLLENLQTINDEIGRVTAMGSVPNTLLDERDALLDKLASIMDISVVENKNNMISVVSNGHVLVQPGMCEKLSVEVTNGYEVSVKYSDGRDFKSIEGDLQAHIDITNSTIPKYMSELDTLAVDFMNAFNAIHENGIATDGTTGLKFFEGDSAKNISVSADILADSDKIATSADGTAGNNEIVLELIAINKNATIDGKYGVMEYYDKLNANLSGETNAMETKMNNYRVVSEEIFQLRANEIGVNTDEETINILKYQQAYSAASKIIQTINEMFETLISAV